MLLLIVTVVPKQSASDLPLSIGTSQILEMHSFGKLMMEQIFSGWTAFDLGSSSCNIVIFKPLHLEHVEITKKTDISILILLEK